MSPYYIGSWNVCDIKWGKDKLQSNMAASETKKDLFKQQTLEESKLKQLDKFLWR
jgi:hypothetical protein